MRINRGPWGGFSPASYTYTLQKFMPKYSEGGIWFPIEDTSSEVAEMGWLFFF